MIYLEQQDLHRLVEILQRFSEFEDEKSRRNFLPLVGLGPILPRMDLTGTPFIASMKIINFLAAHGRLSNGVEALGSLLGAIRAHLGMTEQNVIDEIVTKYNLISPTAHTGSVDFVNGTWSVLSGQDSFPRGASQSIIRCIFSRTRSVNIRNSGNNSCAG